MNSDLLLPLTPSQKPLPDANSPFVATAAAVQDENNENLINTVKRRELLEYDAVDHANTTKRKLPACGETGASGKKTPAGKRIKICEWLDVDKGKVLFPEQKLGLENHPQTIKELAEFYDSVDEPSINEKHHSLLAKLIQDSELDLKHLSMSIASRLYPIPSSVLNSEAQISDSILKIAYRVDYGIQDSAKEANHIWRWEVFNEHLLPESSRSLVIERRNRRIQIAEKINTAIVSLSEQERLILMSTKKSAKSTPTSAIVRQEERLKREQEKEELRKKREQEKEQARLKREQERQAKEAARVKREQEREDAKQNVILRKQEREDTKLRKERERIEKEEARQRSESRQRSISGYFQPIKKAAVAPAIMSSVEAADKSDFAVAFPDFHVKSNVVLAPIVECTLSKDFDKLFSEQNGPILMFKSLKKNLKILGPLRGSVSVELARPAAAVKLLQFHLDYRPPYYGTRMASIGNGVNPRRPCARWLSSSLDYGVDSEEEWEEEEDEEGDECLSNEEDDDEEEDDEDNEDGWLVPHGYLSDGEGCDEDDEDGPQARKPKQSELAREAKRIDVIIPLIIGPEFQQDSDISTVFINYRLGLISADIPIDPWKKCTVTQSIASSSNKPSESSTKPSSWTDSLMAELVQLVHQNTMGLDRLCEEFVRSLPVGGKISKYATNLKIRQIAQKSKLTNEKRSKWIVNEDVLNRFT